MTTALSNMPPCTQSQKWQMRCAWNKEICILRRTISPRITTKMQTALTGSANVAIHNGGSNGISAECWRSLKEPEQNKNELSEPHRSWVENTAWCIFHITIHFFSPLPPHCFLPKVQFLNEAKRGLGNGSHLDLGEDGLCASCAKKSKPGREMCERAPRTKNKQGPSPTAGLPQLL